MYVTQTQIEAEIPAPHLVDALDDDRDGVIDKVVLEQVIATACTDVDAFLGGLFTVPFEEPYPAAVAAAAFVFAGEKIYARRMMADSDRNPFAKRADFWREQLKRIGAGEIPLDAATAKHFTPGAVISEDVSLDSSLR